MEWFDYDCVIIQARSLFLGGLQWRILLLLVMNAYYRLVLVFSLHTISY